MSQTLVSDVGSTDAVVAKLLDMLRKKTRETGEGWSSSTTLADAGIDSFDMVEYVFDIEDAFGIEITFNANQTKDKMETVGDLAAIIMQQLGMKAAA